MPDSEALARIDAALQNWRQGDVVLGQAYELVYLANTDLPLSPASAASPDTGLQYVGEEVAGFLVQTQTCDLVRSCQDRAYVQLHPLVQVAPDFLADVKKGRRPAYAYVPGLAEQGLVADLDRIMTVEKAVLADWLRIPGWHSDDEGRRLTDALIRKIGRFAFPDDFNLLCQSLQRRLKTKHEKQSDEGKALQALREIRVQASPSWSSPRIEIFFWFVLEEDSEASLAGKHLETWLALVPAKQPYCQIDGQIVFLEDLTAQEYLSSERLDLDYLSQSDKA